MSVENFKDLFEQSIKGVQFYQGAIIPAKVTGIDDDYVTLNAGLKSDGIVPIEEFKSVNGELEVNIGDMVEVALDSVENGFGETLLSREKAKRQESWRKLSKSHENNETVTGLISGKVKGGFTVEIGTIRAFLPGSLVDVRPVRDSSYLEGKELEFKVIKMDIKRNNIVVSRRAVVEEESSADRQALLDSLHDGQQLNGVVKNLTDYGAFIDLGGIDGLLHITDISWKRVKHPSELLTVGQEVMVKVLSFDSERNRVSLGMKQLGSDPWSDLVKRHPTHMRLQGKVTNITDYGCFVEIEEGVEGLVHMSEMDWTNKNVHPSKVVSLGDIVDVMVLEIDEDRRWTIPGEEAVKQYKKGQELEAVILAIDSDRERISLGLKQLDESERPEEPTDAYTKGAVVTGTVSSVEPKVVMVTFADNTVGKIKVADLSSEKVADATKVISVGDEVEALVVSVDQKTKVVNLSVKAREANEQDEAMKKYAKGSKGPDKPTFGDLLKEKMKDNNNND